MSSPAHPTQTYDRLLPGTRVLGCFTVERYLGEGSFATVYLARQDGTERRAVVKIAHAALAARPDGDTFLKLFLAEFRAASSVHHPNIATVYLTGTTEDGLPAIAMEYVEGYTLTHLLSRYRAFSPRVIAHMWGQLASALEAVHASNLIHRDLSPDNVLVARQPHTQQLAFKIVDFGLSSSPSVNAHQHLGAVGTPRYMAPEQYNLQPVAASDVYSLGCLLWWAATGQELLGHLHSLQDVHRHFASPRLTPPPIEPLLPTLGAPLARLLVQMLDPDPLRRPSAREIVKTLPLLANAPAQPARTSQGVLPPTGSLGARAASTLSSDLPILNHLQREHKPAASSLRTDAPVSPQTTPPARYTSQETPLQGLSFVDAQRLNQLAPVQRRELIERFLGQMPSLLVELEEAVEGSDLSRLHAVGALIQRAARDVGAAPLLQATDDLLGLSVSSFLQSRNRRLEDLHRAYQLTFRALIPLHHSVR